MKKVLIASALIAAFGTAATAQSIQPVTTAPDTSAVLSTQGGLGLNGGLLVAGFAAVVAVIVVADNNSSDGSGS